MIRLQISFLCDSNPDHSSCFHPVYKHRLLWIRWMNLLFLIFCHKFCPIQNIPGIPHHTASRFCPMFQIHGFKSVWEGLAGSTIIRYPMRHRQRFLVQRPPFLIANTACIIQLCRVQSKSGTAYCHFSVCTVFPIFQAVFLYLYFCVILLHLVLLNF